ncbi:MAG: SRPBCC family protein [Coriobacteriia bacterium]|nr:SRPBCC family protein [Coriobacteriia bacterium]
MRVRRTVYIGQPPDVVLAFVGDHANDRRWRRELDTHEFVGDVREGVGLRMHQAVSYQGRSAELNLEVTDITPGERICYRVHGGVRAHGSYDARPDGPGTLLEVSMTLELKGDQRMLERYLHQALEHIVDEDLDQLKTLLDAETPEELM